VSTPPHFLPSASLSQVAGRLPPDLQAALDAAATLVRTANFIVGLVYPRDWSEVPFDAPVRKDVLALTEIHRREIEECAPAALEAIGAVAGYLNATRDGRPARFGQILQRKTHQVVGDFIVRPNAPLAAYDFADEVTLRLGVAYLNGPPSRPEDVAGCFQNWPLFLHNEIMAEAAIEASRAAQARPPRERLTVDLDSNTATLDGRCFGPLDPDSARILDALRRTGGWITIKKLCEQIGCNHATTLQRWREKLPPELQAIIVGQPGTGLCLQLPHLLG
jgi:hypothetical protein